MQSNSWQINRWDWLSPPLNNIIHCRPVTAPQVLLRNCVTVFKDGPWVWSPIKVWWPYNPTLYNVYCVCIWIARQGMIFKLLSHNVKCYCIGGIIDRYNMCILEEKCGNIIIGHIHNTYKWITALYLLIKHVFISRWAQLHYHGVSSIPVIII